MPVIPTLGRQGQEDQQFKTVLGYIMSWRFILGYMRFCKKKKKKNGFSVSLLPSISVFFAATLAVHSMNKANLTLPESCRLLLVPTEARRELQIQSYSHRQL